MRGIESSAVLLGLLLSTACGGSAPDARTPQDAAATDNEGRHEPSSEEERLLLKKVSRLKSGESAQVGELRVSAAEKYFAASGYECRRVFLESPSQQVVRLACGQESKWFFVPSVNGEGGMPSIDATDSAAQEAPRADVEISPTGEARAVAVSEGTTESKDEDSAPTEETRVEP